MLYSTLRELRESSIRSLMCQAAEEAGLSPLRLGFTGSVNVIKRSLGHFQNLSPEQLPFFFSKLILDILDEKIPPRNGRTNPRVVKKPRSKFQAKKPIHRGTGLKLSPLSFTILNTA